MSLTGWSLPEEPGSLLNGCIIPSQNWNRQSNSKIKPEFGNQGFPGARCHPFTYVSIDSRSNRPERHNARVSIGFAVGLERQVVVPGCKPPPDLVVVLRAPRLARS